MKGRHVGYAEMDGRFSDKVNRSLSLPCAVFLNTPRQKWLERDKDHRSRIHRTVIEYNQTPGNILWFPLNDIFLQVSVLGSGWKLPESVHGSDCGLSVEVAGGEQTEGSRACRSR